MTKKVTIIEVTAAQMRALTWTGDQDGLVVVDLGDSIKIVYESDIEERFMEAVKRMPKKEFYSIIFNTTARLN